MNQHINKQDAAYATEAALNSLFEAEVLRDVLRDIANTSNLDETQIEVLNNIAGERASNAFNAMGHVENYFEQKPKKTKKRKLAVVKKAA